VIITFATRWALSGLSHVAHSASKTTDDQLNGMIFTFNMTQTHHIAYDDAVEEMRAREYPMLNGKLDMLKRED
jgi:hypothetical protein